jgi:ribosomal protein S20
MSTFRLAGLAGLLVVSALIGGTIIGSVAAVTAPPPSQAAPLAAAPSAGAAATGGTAAQYCAAFRRAFAANLGVDESALAPAAKQAAISAIDAAVAAGTITKVAGDRLKARIDAAAASGCALLAGRLGALRAGAANSAAGALGVARDGLAAAARALGTTPAELAAQLRAGHTLKDLATTKGVPYPTVSSDVVSAVRADLDRAVAAGTIKQAREDRIIARLQAALADGRLRAAGSLAPAAPAGSAAPGSAAPSGS